MHWQETMLPLVVAVVLGGLVGFERERANRPAGLRTHILVCLGSTLIMQVSIFMWEAYRHGGLPVDPGRIAAQVVSGIGFLGAGTILREGATVRGLTTAASLWVVAGVGLAVGAGLYGAATATAVIIYATLRFLPLAERRFLGKGGFHTLLVHVTDTPGRLGALASKMGQRGVNIQNVVMRPGPAPGTVEIEFTVRAQSHRSDLGTLVAELMMLEGVVAVHQED